MLKQYLNKILTAALIIPLVQTSAISLSLSTQMKGKILLQVESHGEAWYVLPTDGKRYYLKDGATAYSALRAFGLGISNANIAKIPVGLEPRFQDTDTDGDSLPDQLEDAIGTKKDNADTDGDSFNDGQEITNSYNPLGAGKLTFDSKLINQVKGKILLQTEAHGEAWYVRPDDGKRYYMKNGEAAFQIMRFLSLGITNVNLNKIAVGTIAGATPTSTTTPNPTTPTPLPLSSDAYRNYALAVCYARTHAAALNTFPSGSLRNDMQTAIDDQSQTCNEFTTEEINGIAGLLNTDSDSDGVNALLEQYYGTSDTKADTDGDGVKDLQEIQLTSDQYTWNTAADQVKYEGLLASTSWQPLTMKNRIDGLTFADSQINALSGDGIKIITLATQSNAGCFTISKTSGYLRFEGKTDCATGYWLQATGSLMDLKITTPTLLKSTFAPVSTPSEAAAFVAAITPGLDVDAGDAPKGKVLTLDDGYLVQLSVVKTLGFSHAPQKVIYKVSTDGTVQSLAYERVD
ncbi:MAG: hypothetical protein V1846_00390 [Candidatus Komeilibacteria bacterium]